MSSLECGLVVAILILLMMHNPLEYGQQNIIGLKGHIKMIRNASNQDRNGGKSPPSSASASANKTDNSVSGAPGIDPLSHVRAFSHTTDS